MTYKEAYLKVSLAVSEAQDEYFGRSLNQGAKDKLEDWDKGLDVVEKATKIAEALTNLIAEMEANEDFACRIDRLKSLLEYGK